MQRIQPTTDTFLTTLNQVHQHIAYHEAGHVVAIYLRNHQQNLPPIFFQITIHDGKHPEQPFFAKVDGGRLIENLPIAGIENKRFATEQERQELKHAYEADVINLLAGPLAEAKFVALCDGEIFTPHLVTPLALKNYGGQSDIEQANRYLAYFIPNPEERQLKINDLFNQAFHFINQSLHWQCILHFAQYLLAHEQANISCEEASTVLENFLVN